MLPQTMLLMKRRSGAGGLTITWCMSYLQIYTAIPLRLLNLLTISQAMVQ
uniref:Uncharacterized protein n=1 Tax=Rhizophora mucronata TaxID=61149 RepID=A0A2P2KGZ7_RHIMU